MKDDSFELWKELMLLPSQLLEQPLSRADEWYEWISNEASDDDGKNGRSPFRLFDDVAPVVGVSNLAFDVWLKGVAVNFCENMKTALMDDNLQHELRKKSLVLRQRPDRIGKTGCGMMVSLCVMLISMLVIGLSPLLAQSH
jgi:hypothetical protein